MANEAYLYPWSREDAQDRNELELWQKSHDANVDCRKAIEAAIMREHDGNMLTPGCAAGVIAEYGYKRVRFVLASTVQYLEYDGRFSDGNRAWAKQTYAPRDHLAEISAANSCCSSSARSLSSSSRYSARFFSVSSVSCWYFSSAARSFTPKRSRAAKYADAL